VASLVDPFRPYLEERWQEGCQNAAVLWREIKTQGFASSLNTIRRWAEPRRPDASGAATGPAASAPAPKPPRAPSQRRCAWLLGMESDKLTEGERPFVDRLTAAAPKLAEAGALARRFAAMVRRGDSAALDGWLTAAQKSEPGSLAPGLTRDLAALRPGVTEPWSTSLVEGQISRLKTIKRQMYGRAGVADDGAARGQHLIHHPQAERETEAKSNGEADDLGQKPEAGVAGISEWRHSVRLLGAFPARKPVSR
jgi:transposase